MFIGMYNHTNMNLHHEANCAPDVKTHHRCHLFKCDKVLCPHLKSTQYIGVE